MAKSIRSKWRRKCRAVKRERYAEKELVRLKKTLGLESSNSKDINMTEISDVATVVDAKTIERKVKEDVDVMDVEAIKKKYNPKTFRDKNGAYPVWVHPRKIVRKSKRVKKQIQKQKIKQVKSGKKSKRTV